MGAGHDFGFFVYWVCTLAATRAATVSKGRAVAPVSNQSVEHERSTASSAAAIVEAEARPAWMLETIHERPSVKKWKYR